MTSPPKRTFSLDPHLWEQMEAHLLSVMDTLKPKATFIASVLLEKFPYCGVQEQTIRKSDQVKAFVRGMRAGTQTYVADKLGDEKAFTKLDHTETEFIETPNGASFKGTYEVSQFDSPEAYLESKNICLKKYEITSMGLKTYQGYINNKEKGMLETVTLNSVFAKFKPRVAQAGENAVKALLTEFKSYVSPVPRFTYQKQEACAAIINLFDAHLEKVCLVTETGYGSTIEDNVTEFERLFDTLLAHAVSYNPELIIFPVGNDFFNVNGPSNSTKKGTPQAVSMKSHDAFVIGSRLLRRSIDKAKQVAKVKIMVVKGNHDEDIDFYLGQVLAAVYEADANVEVDTDRKQRKYIQYGINLWGFAHGDKEARKVSQLPLMMAEEQKQAWADTTYRTFFLGDKHHTMEYQFLRAKDYVGCLVKFLRSIGTTDEWHYDNGYIGIPRTGEVEIHSKQGGMIGHHFAHAQYRSKVAS